MFPLPGKKGAQRHETPMQDILILGGTGFVGRSLCVFLAGSEQAPQLTVPTRHMSQEALLRMPRPVALVSADIGDSSQLVKLVEGKAAVVNLVAVLHGDDAQFARVHVDLVRSLVEACKSTNVRRIIHVSALGVDSGRPSRYLRSKAAGEAVLKGSGLDVTVLRPSVIYGEQDRFLNMFARLSAFVPILPLACADARFQPVWVEDVVRAIAACLARPETAGQTFECAGPEVFTLAQLVKLAGEWSGHKRPIVPLSHALGSLQAAVMELLPGEPLMSRDNLQSMQTPNVLSGQLPTLEALGIQPAALRAIGPKYLEHRRA
jgi:uncharacterized protein YbjT (DUF2867 family)